MTAHEETNNSAAGLILLVALDERNALHSAIDSLGNKATSVLAFNGALIALIALFGDGWPRFLVTGLLVVGTVAAFWALAVRRYPTLKPVVLRDRYVEQRSAVAERVILDTLIAQWPELEDKAAHRARWVKIATGISAAGFVALVILLSWTSV
jgi:hypothetical protein